MSVESIRRMQRAFGARVEGASDDERHAIYRRNALRARVRALSIVFPVCRRVVGQECFEGVAREYVRRHPVASASLDDEGRGFDGVWTRWLERLDEPEGYAYLPDLARFERARHDAFCAPRDEPFDWGSLAGVDPQRLWGFAPVVSASLRLVEVEWPILELYQEDTTGFEGHVWAHRRAGVLAQGACSAQWAAWVRSWEMGLPLGELHELGCDQEALSQAVARGWIVGLEEV